VRSSEKAKRLCSYIQNINRCVNGAMRQAGTTGCRRRAEAAKGSGIELGREAERGTTHNFRVLR